MKKDDLQTLNFQIQELYKRLESNKKFYNLTLNKLSKRINILKLIDIFTNKEFRNDLSTSEIYWLYKNYNDAISNDDLNINLNNITKLEYEFTEREVNNAEMLFIDNIEKNNNTLEIKNVIEVEEDREYLVAKVTAKELNNIFAAVSWNPFAQREVTTKVVSGYGAISIPTIYKRNVEEIKQKMLNGEFFSNMISLNILKTDEGSERYEYDNLDNVLRFTKDKGSVLDCIDGFHRLTAISELVQEHPEVADRVHMQLKIWIMDITEAAAFVNQEASGTVLSVEKRNITANDLYMDIVKDLALKGNSKKNALLNKMGELDEIKNNLKFYSLDLFRETLLDNITINNTREANMLSRFLKAGWNEIIFANEELFNLNDKNNTNALVNNNILAFFNYILIKLYENEQLKDEYLDIINLILEEVDFNILTNSNWSNIKIDSKRYDKSIRRNIYEYAKKVLESVVNK